MDKYVAKYLRLSKEDEDTVDESNSITNQRLLVDKFIESDDILKYSKSYEYVDDGYSGKNFDRPSIKQMLEDVKNNKISCIVVKDFSRFARDYIEVGKYVEKVFPFMGVRFISINNHFDSIDLKDGQTPDIDFSFQNLIYDYYSVDNSIKINKVLDKKRCAGQYMAVYAPFGYAKDPLDNNHLVVDEKAAQFVRLIYNLYLETGNKEEVARILMKENIPTPALYKKQEGLKYNWKYNDTQGKWSGAIVGKIIKNPVYTGTVVNGKRIVKEIGSKSTKAKGEDEWNVSPNMHEPIISKELFDKANNFKLPQIGVKDYHKRYSNESVLKGYIKCGGCKHNLVRRARKTPSYYCRGYYALHTSSCLNGPINEKDIYNIVLLEIKKQLVLIGATKNIIKLKENRQEVKRKLLDKEIVSKRQKIKELNEENFKNYYKYQNGKLAREEFVALKKSNLQNSKQLEDELTVLEYQMKAQEKDVSSDSILDIHNGGREVDSLTEEIIKKLVDKIYVYPNKEVVIKLRYVDETKRLYMEAMKFLVTITLQGMSKMRADSR